MEKLYKIITWFGFIFFSLALINTILCGPHAYLSGVRGYLDFIDGKPTYYLLIFSQLAVVLACIYELWFKKR